LSVPADVSRILILSLVFPPDSVSTAEIMGELASDLRARGHAVSVLTTTPHYNRDPEAERRQPMRPVWGPLIRRSEFGGVPVYHVAMPAKTANVVGRIVAWAGFHLVSTIAALVLIERPDVILVPSPPLSIGASAWIVGACRRAPFVYNVQEIYPDIAVNLGALKNRRAIAALESLERFVYGKAAAVTVIAPRMRRRLIEKSVPPGKVHVIPNFVDVDRLAPAPRHNEFSRRHGLDDVCAVTYAGNMGPAQGLDIVIDAARLLPPDSRVRFLLVGEGILRSRLAAEAAALPHANVGVLPYQPNAMMPQIYGASDVSLVPQAAAIGSDAIPSKVYRIMASGRPLIAVTEHDSDLAALVREAGCGAIVPPGDAVSLAGAVTDAAQRAADWRAMGLRGRDHVVTHYAREVVSAQYDALLRCVQERDAR
jgi:colanic acid biosynthesis glycosyl transferase WcaI